MIYNKETGVFADVNMREAVNAVIDSDEVLLAALTHDQVGTIEEGKIANIIIVNGNPSEDIINLENMDNFVNVIKDGEVVKGII